MHIDAGVDKGSPERNEIIPTAVAKARIIRCATLKKIETFMVFAVPNEVRSEKQQGKIVPESNLMSLKSIIANPRVYPGHSADEVYNRSVTSDESDLRLSSSEIARPTTEPLLHLQNVHKVFVTDAGEFHALRDINLRIQPGEFVSIIGKSGSGKSTLLNMLTGIDQPTSGKIFVADTAIHTLTQEEIARWRGRSVGIIFQFFQLLPTLTAVENVLLPMDYSDQIPIRERPDRAMHLLELVDMAEQAHSLPSTLSGGEQQRVAIARALANDPPLLTADEPTGNLDSKTAENVMQLFEDLVARNKTILMVTHDDDLTRRAERTIQLADGYIVDEWMNQ